MGRCFYSNYNDYLLCNRVRVVSLSSTVIFRFQSKAYTLMRFAFLILIQRVCLKEGKIKKSTDFLDL